MLSGEASFLCTVRYACGCRVVTQNSPGLQQLKRFTRRYQRNSMWNRYSGGRTRNTFNSWVSRGDGCAQDREDGQSSRLSCHRQALDRRGGDRSNRRQCQKYLASSDTIMWSWDHSVRATLEEHLDEVAIAHPTSTIIAEQSRFASVFGTLVRSSSEMRARWAGFNYPLARVDSENVSAGRQGCELRQRSWALWWPLRAPSHRTRRVRISEHHHHH